MSIIRFALYFFPLNTGNKSFVKFKPQFYQQLYGTVIVNLIQGSRSLALQMKIQNNVGVLDFVNTSNITLFCNKNETLGIADIRFLGYFKIRHSTLKYCLAQRTA